MAKHWWFKLDFRLWQSDPALSQCSVGARGFWLEILCSMYAQNTYMITGSLEQIGRMARCDSAEVARYSLELKNTNSADVTIGHGNVTLMSRRLQRTLSTKENNKLRKRKERCHIDVTPQSNKQEVISKKEEENTDVFSGVSASEIDYVETVMNGLRNRLNLNTLRDEQGWSVAITWSMTNNFTPEAFLDCYDSLSQQTWRKSRITPSNVADNLPNLDKIKKALQEEKNGTHQRNGKRTDQDVFAESADFYAKYPDIIP